MIALYGLEYGGLGGRGQMLVNIEVSRPVVESVGQDIQSDYRRSVYAHYQFCFLVANLTLGPWTELGSGETIWGSPKQI